MGAQALAHPGQPEPTARPAASRCRGDDATLLDVRDDGVGFDPAAPARNGPGSGFGLAGMRERLASHGGTLTIETAPGQGTTVAAVVPRGLASADEQRR